MPGKGLLRKRIDVINHFGILYIMLLFVTFIINLYLRQ